MSFNKVQKNIPNVIRTSGKGNPERQRIDSQMKVIMEQAQHMQNKIDNSQIGKNKKTLKNVSIIKKLSHAQKAIKTFVKKLFARSKKNKVSRSKQPKAKKSSNEKHILLHIKYLTKHRGKKGKKGITEEEYQKNVKHLYDEKFITKEQYYDLKMPEDSALCLAFMGKLRKKHIVTEEKYQAALLELYNDDDITKERYEELKRKPGKAAPLPQKKNVPERQLLLHIKHLTKHRGKKGKKGITEEEYQKNVKSLYDEKFITKEQYYDLKMPEDSALCLAFMGKLRKKHIVTEEKYQAALLELYNDDDITRERYEKLKRKPGEAAPLPQKKNVPKSQPGEKGLLGGLGPHDQLQKKSDGKATKAPTKHEENVKNFNRILHNRAKARNNKNPNKIFQGKPIKEAPPITSEKGLLESLGPLDKDVARYLKIILGQRDKGPPYEKQYQKDLSYMKGKLTERQYEILKNSSPSYRRGK